MIDRGEAARGDGALHVSRRGLLAGAVLAAAAFVEGCANPTVVEQGDGLLQKSWHHKGHFAGNFIADDSLVYTVNNERPGHEGLRGTEVVTGSKRWENKGLGEVSMAGLYAGTIVVNRRSRPSDAAFAAGLDAESGTRKWEWPTARAALSRSNGQLLTVAEAGPDAIALTLLNMQSGKRIGAGMVHREVLRYLSPERPQTLYPSDAVHMYGYGKLSLDTLTFTPVQFPDGYHAPPTGSLQADFLVTVNRPAGSSLAVGRRNEARQTNKFGPLSLIDEVAGQKVWEKDFDFLQDPALRELQFYERGDALYVVAEKVGWPGEKWQGPKDGAVQVQLHALSLATGEKHWSTDLLTVTRPHEYASLKTDKTIAWVDDKWLVVTYQQKTGIATVEDPAAGMLVLDAQSGTIRSRNATVKNDIRGHIIPGGGSVRSEAVADERSVYAAVGASICLVGRNDGVIRPDKAFYDRIGIKGIAINESTLLVSAGTSLRAYKTPR